MIKFFKGLFKGKDTNKQETSKKSFIINEGINSLEDPYIQDEDYLSIPEKHSWVYACVSAIGSCSSGVPIKVVKRNEKGSWEVLNRKNPIVSLLEDINNFQFQQEFIEHIALRLASAGKCFVEILRNKKGKAIQLKIIEYSTVRLLIDQAGNIAFYEFVVNGRTVKLPFSDVLYFRLPHPNNIYDGLSPLSSAREAVLSDFYAQKYNKAFFKNGATLRGVLQTEKGLSNRAWSRLKDMWQNIYGGVGNAHKTLVLEEGIEYKPISLNPKDMEFISQRKFSREEILATFKTYPVVLGILDQASYSNAQAQVRLFYEQTISYYLKKLSNTLTYFAISELIDPDIRVVFDFTQVQALTATMSEISSWGSKFTNSGILLINEVRDFLGKVPTPYGDTWFANSAMIPIADMGGLIPRPELGDSTVGGGVVTEGLPYNNKVRTTSLSGIDLLQNDPSKMVSDHLIVNRVKLW